MGNAPLTGVPIFSFENLTPTSNRYPAQQHHAWEDRNDLRQRMATPLEESMHTTARQSLVWQRQQQCLPDSAAANARSEPFADYLDRLEQRADMSDHLNLSQL